MLFVYKMKELASWIKKKKCEVIWWLVCMSSIYCYSYWLIPWLYRGEKQCKGWCLIFSKAALRLRFEFAPSKNKHWSHIWLIHLKRIKLFLAHPVQSYVPAVEFITRCWNHSIMPFYTQRSLTGTIKLSEVISPTGPSEFMRLIPGMWFSLSLSHSSVCAAVSLLFSEQIDTTPSLTVCGREYVHAARKKWLKLEFCSKIVLYMQAIWPTTNNVSISKLSVSVNCDKIPLVQISEYWMGTVFFFMLAWLGSLPFWSWCGSSVITSFQHLYFSFWLIKGLLGLFCFAI